MWFLPIAIFVNFSTAVKMIVCVWKVEYVELVVRIRFRFNTSMDNNSCNHRLGVATNHMIALLPLQHLLLRQKSTCT